jgi:hypothetical protein
MALNINNTQGNKHRRIHTQRLKPEGYARKTVMAYRDWEFYFTMRKDPDAWLTQHGAKPS